MMMVLLCCKHKTLRPKQKKIIKKCAPFQGQDLGRAGIIKKAIINKGYESFLSYGV